jgi:hypothetical protein
MRWVLRLIGTGDDARRLSTDLVEICRPEGLGNIANLGLTDLTALVQFDATLEAPYRRQDNTIP